MFAAALVTQLVSCSGSPPDTPASSGPWAAEFERLMETTDSDFTRAVLDDYRIDDVEYAETVARFQGCLGGYGLEAQEYEPDGSFVLAAADGGQLSVVDPDFEVHTKECQDSSGETEIITLYSSMRLNPDNLDTATLMIECLKSANLVEESFSEADYAEAFDAGADWLESPEFAECAEDPLGATRQ
ncbi:MAG: hypothetical protein LBH48_05080 [Bifidobacteriaceae bacterium]|nr:hypothetical protein [Bifidobacteriaceae bacterium]